MESVADATERAIAAASILTPADAGAVAALRVLAAKIDTDDALRAAYVEWFDGEGARPARPLQMDNVSIPTYLKYCDALGMTPAARGAKVKPEEPAGVSKLEQLRRRQAG